MYKWMRQTYIAKLQKELEEAIEDEKITEEEAETIFNRELDAWNDGYGDYMYDLKGDR